MIGPNTAPKEQLPRFTIIIAVTHSLKCLEDCLKSLDKLDYPRELFHVVLVDCHVLSDLKVFFDEKLGSYRYQISTISLPEKRVKHNAWLHDGRNNEARNAAMLKVPAQYFVFTEDDCMFEPDWLTKFDTVLQDDTGAVGGPDIIPEGMGWFARALDCILSSFLGTAGMKRGDGFKKDWYYPRQHNTVIPAKVIERVGLFPEDVVLGTELEMANRIREIGLQIKYLPDNPVWHWRETTYFRFVRRNVYQTALKVKLLRRRQAFSQSPHFLVLMTAVSALILSVFSLFNNSARSIFFAVAFLYMVLVFVFAASSMVRTRSLAVGLGVILLLPSHHISIILGVMKGTTSRVKG